MRRKLGLSMLLVNLTAFIPATAESTQLPVQESSHPSVATPTVVEAVLVEVRTDPPPPGPRIHLPSRRTAELRFRHAYLQSTGEKLATRLPGRNEFSCTGIVNVQSAQRRRGGTVCLYARPSTTDVWRCKPHRWHLERYLGCEEEEPVFSDDPIVCTPVSDHCEKIEDEPLRIVAVGPYLHTDSAVVATSGFNKTDAVGGYLQQGEVLVGREPRARAEGDLNGDGRLDLIVAHAGALTVAVYLATPDGPPEQVSLFELERDACEMNIRNFDDGPHPDLIVLHCTSSKEPREAWSVFLGDGKGNFEPGTTIRTSGP